jgi:hypothetical protein
MALFYFSPRFSDAAGIVAQHYIMARCARVAPCSSNGECDLSGLQYFTLRIPLNSITIPIVQFEPFVCF